MVSSATAYSDMDPQPRVQLVIESGGVGSSVSVTVWQVSDAGSFPVRNAKERAVAGGFSETDFEMPLGVPVTYRVEGFDGSGNSLGFVLTLGPVTASIPVGYVVISDPLAPANAVLLRAQLDFASRLSWGRTMALYTASGRTFALAGPARPYQGVPLRVITETDEDRRALLLILAEALVLVRTMGEMGAPGALFVVFSEVPRSLRAQRLDGGVYELTEIWDLVGDQVTRPELEILLAVYSYDRYKTFLDGGVANSGTYNEAATTWATYLTAMANPPAEA